jgi:hypothetical protein
VRPFFVTPFAPLSAAMGHSRSTPATELGAIVVRETPRRASLDPGVVGTVVPGRGIGFKRAAPLSPASLPSPCTQYQGPAKCSIGRQEPSRDLNNGSRPVSDALVRPCRDAGRAIPLDGRCLSQVRRPHLKAERAKHIASLARVAMEALLHAELMVPR